jgi:hypothetical protein
MNQDSVLREVRVARDTFARAHGYDVGAMVETLRAEDERGDRPVVRLAPRRPVFPGAFAPEPDRASERAQRASAPPNRS